MSQFGQKGRLEEVKVWPIVKKKLKIYQIRFRLYIVELVAGNT